MLDDLHTAIASSLGPACNMSGLAWDEATGSVTISIWLEGTPGMVDACRRAVSCKLTEDWSVTPCP